MRSAAVTALVAGGIVAGAGSAAQAVPSGCGNSKAVNNGYWAYCSSGTGEYQAAVTCWYNHGASSRTRTGPWRAPNGTASEVHCLSSEELGGYWINKR